MCIRNLAVGSVMVALALTGFVGCSDDGNGQGDVTDGDGSRSDVLPSVEFRDRVTLIVGNEASEITLIEASEAGPVAFGAFDSNLILQGSEQEGASYWHFIGANDGADLLMGTEMVTVRFSDDDTDGTGELAILDATEAPIATRDDFVLDADELSVDPGRDVPQIVQSLEATEADLNDGRWRALATGANELLAATESAPQGLFEQIEDSLLLGVESVRVIREGLLRAEEDLTSGGAPTGPDVFRVPEDNDEFLASVEAEGLLATPTRDAFRELAEGIARELLLLAANEAVPGNFLPALLLTLDGTEVTVGETSADPFTGAKSVSTGANHTCAIDLNDRVFCWGDNDNGQLGIGNRLPEIRPQPTGARTYDIISIGGDTSCAVALESPSRGFCWGSNDSGQVALDLSVDDAPSPEALGDTELRSIGAGGDHACYVSTAGALFCWGDNGDAQLGIPAVTDTTSTPTQVVGNTNWDAVSTGAIHTCAINDLGELFCWGFNTDGRAGLGDILEGDTPTQVGTDTWKQVSAGGAFSCGINAADELFCWGQNDFGQLGDGSTFGSTTPIQVGTDTWNSVSAGFLHACAIRSDNALFCWGSNSFGRLGLGDSEQREVPTRVGTESWSAVSASTSHSCAIRADDSSVWCWGTNATGQLGTGDTLTSLVPAPVAE